MTELTSANICMSCGGQVSRNPVTGKWLHDREADWLSGGAHPPVLPGPPPSP